jgi:hypothetical protein
MVSFSFWENPMFKKIVLVFSVAALAILIPMGQSHFRQRNALKIVQTVLAFWENNDLVPAMAYWEKAIDAPPVYDLLMHEIGRKEFIKKNGLYHARIFVTLYFPTGNRFPSGREWVFELSKTRYGWKIVGFRPEP